MRVLKAIGFAILGFIAAFVMTAALGLMLIPGHAGDSGGREMFVFFGLGPLGGLIGAIAGFVICLMRDRKPPA
jgi:hypothetical protein